MGNKQVINEVIVVEGKNDTHRLKQFFNCETIETNGSGITKETIEYIKEINEKRGVIVFTDPDAPGEKIRTIINNAAKGCKNAFVLANDARGNHKVGIEHASKEVLLEALKHTVTYSDSKIGSITIQDIVNLGLSGSASSSFIRYEVAKKLHIGTCNSKTFLKRVNMLNLSIEDLEKVVREINE